MKITLSIPNYDKSEGIRVPWVGNHQISVHINDTEVTIAANKDGLITLAKQLLTLAHDGMPSGHHIHLTDRSGLEEGSLDLTLQRM